MERLTEKVFVVPKGEWLVLNDEQYDKYKDAIDRPKYADLYSRLGMLENLLCGDKREYNIDRLRELIEADREGRCVVLPAKIGDTFYRVGASVCKYRSIDKCDRYCDGDQYADCWEGEQIVVPETFRLNILESVGKTVFRTPAQGRSRPESDERGGINMEKQIDICKSCCYSVENYTSVIGTIPYCCEKHWHCKPGGVGVDYKPKVEKKESENDG